MDANKTTVQEEDEIDLLELFGVLFRHKFLIIIATVIAAIAALAFSIISIKLPPEKSPLPNKYKAKALILINEQDGGGLPSILSSSQLGPLAMMASVSSGSSYGDLAIKLLNSKSILDKIIEKYNLVERYKIEEYFKANSRAKLLDNSDFDYEERTNTVAISFEDYDAVFATDVTNSMIELLDQRFSTIGGNRNLTQKSLLENKLADVLAEMAKVETLIIDFQEKHGVLTVEALATEQITTLAELRSQLILKEMEIKTYSDFSKIEDPVIKRLKSERDNMLRMIREVEEGFSSYEKVMPPQKEIPELALEFAHLKRDLFVQEKIYEILTQQYELIKLSLEAEAPIFQVLELADVPDKKSSPSRSLICIITVFIAFFLSIIISFILNAIKNIKNDPERMKKLRGKS